MAHTHDLKTVLNPVLTVNIHDASALQRAVTEVAESLAFLGTLFVTKDRKVISGLTDEQAVINTLNRYVADKRTSLGVHELVGVQNVVSAITRLPRPVPPALAARRS